METVDEFSSRTLLACPQTVVLLSCSRLKKICESLFHGTSVLEILIPLYLQQEEEPSSLLRHLRQPKRPLSPHRIMNSSQRPPCVTTVSMYWSKNCAAISKMVRLLADLRDGLEREPSRPHHPRRRRPRQLREPA